MVYRNQREATASIQSLVKLQPWFLSLRWETCLRQNCSLGSCACNEGPALGQNTLMMIFLYYNALYISISVNVDSYFMLIMTECLHTEATSNRTLHFPFPPLTQHSRPCFRNFMRFGTLDRGLLVRL